ncbi:hypothetical protein MesoLjLa_30810 [Mesorhizobium sp. L-2-11]|nr:hypothetical protein MesoLjLa_30810 [Mesorhizobium sp. L-2-11]
MLKIVLRFGTAALLGGEEEERSGIDKTFAHVLRQWALLTGQHMRTALVSQGASLFAPVVPVLLCAPKFLEGEMTLGQVMQAASAFAIVQGAFGWLVDNYPRLANWNACARRIGPADRPQHHDEGRGRQKRVDDTGDEIDRGFGGNPQILGDAGFGVLVVAADEVQLKVAAACKPTRDDRVGEPGTPAALNRHAKEDLCNDKASAAEHERHENGAQDVDGARIALLEGIENCAIPDIDPILEANIDDDQEQ